VAVDDLGRVTPLGGIRYLNAADQVPEDMLTGWRRQQLSRNLGLDTIDGPDACLANRTPSPTGSRPFCCCSTPNRSCGSLRCGPNKSRSRRARSLSCWARNQPCPRAVRTAATRSPRRRPNLRTANTDGSPWLFPGNRAGRHLHAQSIMDRLRTLGIDLLGSRNAALRDLVRQVPAPIVATQLGYSHQVTQRHAALAAEPMSKYAAVRSRDSVG
jgi:hypothetical protein